MLIKRFVNTVFNSNTYLLYKLEEETAWVIDPGSSTEQLINWLENHQKSLGGILLTHTHFDHIYGLNTLQELFPSVNIYASEYAKEGMISWKVNGSDYLGIPFIINNTEYITIKEGFRIFLWKEIQLDVYETPGHAPDCLSFYFNNYLFTGDALIPGVKVYTKLKNGNKRQAENSIRRIMDQFDRSTVILPGHEKFCFLGSLNNTIF